MSEKKDAENITPAAKPKKIFSNLGEISFLRIKKTDNAPSVVQININDIPINTYK